MALCGSPNCQTEYLRALEHGLLTQTPAGAVSEARIGAHRSWCRTVSSVKYSVKRGRGRAG
jgi:hypothetical protein